MEQSTDVVRDDQIVTLEGGQNFRQIGGYPTTDGRRLRRGLLWRSAGLGRLTRADIAMISSLGIATIADLRSRSEREHSPSPADLLSGTRVLSWDEAISGDDEGVRDLVRAQAAPEAYFGAVVKLYEGLARSHRTHLGDLYASIADGAVPILIHCAAGKDRTGIAVGLLLDLIGVQRPCILSDYAKTEHLLDWERLTQDAAAAGASREWLARISKEAMAVLMRSDPRYLAAAIGAIEQEHGSIRAFAIEVLGLSEARLGALWERLLEPA